MIKALDSRNKTPFKKSAARVACWRASKDKSIFLGSSADFQFPLNPTSDVLLLQIASAWDQFALARMFDAVLLLNGSVVASFATGCAHHNLLCTS